jgi:transposase
VSHRNAPLSELGRLRLARCVVEEGWPLRRAAERFQVAPTTAARWAGRYRYMGAAGMGDRSSRPQHSPRRTPTRIERRIIKVRVLRRWGPARIGYLLGLHPSTVHRVLTRCGMAKLRWLDRPTGRVVRRIEPTQATIRRGATMASRAIHRNTWGPSAHCAGTVCRNSWWSKESIAVLLRGYANDRRDVHGNCALSDSTFGRR